MEEQTKLTVAGAAANLGCTIDYVYRLLRGKKLLGAYKKDKVWLIPVSALEKYREERK